MQLSGGIGRTGDPYERHADAVAEAVVAGRSAEGLLEPFTTSIIERQPNEVSGNIVGLPDERTSGADRLPEIASDSLRPTNGTGLRDTLNNIPYPREAVRLPEMAHNYNVRTADHYVVQRVIQGYVAQTLASHYTVMRDLTSEQRETVQYLHEQPEEYTPEQAREIAVMVSGTSTINPYVWEVTGLSSYLTTDPSVANIVKNFGYPTQPVVKAYTELADRIKYDVGPSRTGALSTHTITDLHLHFDASLPLHMGFNSFLNSTWVELLENYTGAKTGIPLYTFLRSGFTNELKDVYLGSASLNELLKEVSGRPPEVHHLLFKAIYQDLATVPQNLVLASRSEHKSKGLGQHELLHTVASGSHPDIFKKLLPQYVEEYIAWLKNRGVISTDEYKEMLKKVLW